MGSESRGGGEPSTELLARIGIPLTSKPRQRSRWIVSLEGTTFAQSMPYRAEVLAGISTVLYFVSRRKNPYRMRAECCK